MLEVLDVSKSYHGIPAVRSVAFTATPGDVIGLLGPNGSGKTTTVKMIVGLLTPTRGHIRWRGIDIQDQLLDYQAIVGYVPEEPRLYAYLTAVEYLELVGGLRDIDPKTLAARIERYVELFGLSSDRYTPLSSFSKGMRQKVLLAAALIHDPQIVLLDEPNSGLDVASTLILRTLVRTLAERGKIIIYTALFSRDSDPMEFALWMLALIATPPAFFAARQIFLYTSLVNAPIEVVEQVALADRLFFVIYGMLAAGLLAALTWESLFPDGRDQETIGTLPVRPWTFAAARLGAAVTLGACFTAAVNVPAALVYTAVSAAHPALRNIPGLLTGHILATMFGSLLAYFTLLTLRGIAAIVFGIRAGAWLGAALQLVTMVLLVEALFFLPGVLGTLVKAMLGGDSSAIYFPAVWFASLHAWVAGSTDPVLAAGARLAVLSVAATAFATVPVYLIPARWLGRRALESRRRERAVSIMSAVRAMARFTATSPPVRGMYVFAVASCSGADDTC